MAAITNGSPTVTVEYDCRGERATKTFDDAYAAKRFYIEKHKAERNPKVTGTNPTSTQQETHDMTMKNGENECDGSAAVINATTPNRRLQDTQLEEIKE